MSPVASAAAQAEAPTSKPNQREGRGTPTWTTRLLGPGRWLWAALLPYAEALANHTVLFRVGSTVWVTYGGFVALGGVVGALANAPLLAGFGISATSIGVYQCGLVASMLVGGRMVWLLYEWRLVRREPYVALRRVGFVSFGGYLGLVLVTAVFAWLEQVDPLGLFDRVAPVAFLISVFGRLGCLSYGCCFGRPCFGGLRWWSPQAKVNRERGALGSLPRVPTPLLSAASALVASAAGVVMLARPSAPGSATALCLLVYAGLRFAVEYSRDEFRCLSGKFTRGQLGAAALGIAAIVLWTCVPGVVEAQPRSTAQPSVQLDFSVLTTHWPVVLILGLILFLVTGYHRREVGRW